MSRFEKNLLTLKFLSWLALVVGLINFAEYFYMRFWRDRPIDLPEILGITAMIMAGLIGQLAGACLSDIAKRSPPRS